MEILKSKIKYVKDIAEKCHQILKLSDEGNAVSVRADEENLQGDTGTDKWMPLLLIRDDHVVSASATSPCSPRVLVLRGSHPRAFNISHSK